MQRIAYRNKFASLANGFTLIELLITLAVGTIVMGIGVPSLLSLVASNHQSGEINTFVRHLNLARSYAVKTGRDHVLCPSTDLLSCHDATRWDQGFILFEDSNENGVREADETLVYTSRPSGKFGIDMQSTRGRKKIIYRADGRSAGSNLTLTFCDPEGDVTPKAVILSNTGRARISRTRWDGSALRCSG
ncbi:MAG: GspH/FimT family pseudopilin [Candidatus Thiodiazotropha sp. (ex Myrtea sp. 'scaly one' KF741663)]|nr:GspH/FimT family pseudopilin [Candidatus Thiodiazotropha sp. (ex Myrtea sp. 'scaly one' KF741663)]